jgi:predicted nucleic-acid-binding protein
MITLDTNILARYLLDDDKQQAELATQLLSSEQAFSVPATVMLELAWVLKANGCSKLEVLKGLRWLTELPNLQPKPAGPIQQALDWFEAGMDFGDALHLALSESSVEMLTFDKRFAQRAKSLSATPQVRLLSNALD